MNHFSGNLQILRKANGNLSQEALADTLNVSRQTVSKWESGAAYPEVDKLVTLAEFFHVTLDQLLLKDLNKAPEAYSPVEIVKLDRFRMAQYVVISGEPEDDSIAHMQKWAKQNGLEGATMIGCDVPMLTIEQKTVYGLRGYLSAVILPGSFTAKCMGVRESWQETAKYARITVRDPFRAPFDLIPGAYKAILKHIEDKAIRHGTPEGQLSCFEHVYTKDGTEHMDIYIMVDMLTPGGGTITL